MSNITTPAVRPLKPIAWLMTALKPALNDEPVVLRGDAAKAHEVVYQGKGTFLVRTNPARQTDYETKRRAIEDAAHAKVEGAASVRDKKIADLKAAYKAGKEAADEEYRTIDAVATKEREAAIASLDREFSAPPVVAATEAAS